MKLEQHGHGHCSRRGPRPRRGAPPAPAPAVPKPERPASRARDFRTIRAQQKRIQQERAEAARKFAASQSDRAAAERAKVEQTQREIDEIRARTQRPARDEWAAVADPGGFGAEAACIGGRQDLGGEGLDCCSL